MKRIFQTISLVLLLAIALPAVAQKRNTKSKTKAPVLPDISLAEAIRQYRFDEAMQILNAEIETLENNGQSTAEAEEKLRSVERAKSRLNATEQVVFIDSLVVPRETLFQYLKLSSESGSVLSYNTYFNNAPSTFQKDDAGRADKSGSTEQILQPEQRSQDCSVFISQLQDKLIFSKKNANGETQLFSSELIGNEWSKPELLQGLDDLGSSQMNYPFMLTDGMTLYFAAQGEESLGGYDIFMTRYDVDEHRFLTPENIGMPFNSPANDYLYLLDEYNNLGWFVTDRNQTDDQVCIYMFIPNEFRRIYNSAQISAEKLRSLARLNSISDTWTDRQSVDDALARLIQLNKKEAQNAHGSSAERFIINDNVVCLHESDFKSEEAKKLYIYWKEGKAQENTLSAKLSQLRTSFAKSNHSATSQSTDTATREEILALENRLRQLNTELHKQEKEIRRIEIQAR